MQVSYHKAIIEDCDYKIIMFYLYVYFLSFQFWYMQCALTHQVLKAVRRVTEQEEEVIKKNVLMGYSADSPWFPSGLCLKCIHYISSAAKGEV